MRHLVVVAAGTGGHVMPGLAVAGELRARGWTVSWLGTKAGMERRLVEPRDIEFDALDFSGLRGKGWKTLLLGGFHLLRALRQSRAALRARRPSLVFSTGGYVAVPAGLAASWHGAPLALLNADAAPLLSTKMLRSLASAVFCGFDGEAARLARDKGLVTGNPVRDEIARVAAPDERYAQRQGPLNLLVVGGSLGSQVLNQVLPAALAQLGADARPCVVHQCGAQHVDATRAAYAALNVEAEVIPFIDDIAARYAAADVVLCRAGAITVTELCVAGVASILVPFVVSTTAHQRTNAEFLARHGAALHLAQQELTVDRLAQLLRGLKRAQLAEMARKARALGRPDATRVVADAIEHIAAEAGR
jgi:UDP-N-acetylglucosamine--N-acetylmuramyl-(pentapeptide) pyrophosphoryl-undecaprenol N-acetylglucosamine transferase